MALSCQRKVYHQRIGHHLHIFTGLGVMNDAAESNCILSIGDDGSLNGGCSSSELIIIEINSESEFQQPADWNGVINQVKKLWHVV